VLKRWHFRKRNENILQVLNVVLGKMEKITWTDRVRNDEVFHRVKEDKNILHTTKGMKDEWNGHMLRWNWLLKHVTEDMIEGTRRRGIRHKQQPDYLKLKIWYWNFKEETPECTLERTRLGRGYGRVARKDCAMKEWMDGWMLTLLMISKLYITYNIQIYTYMYSQFDLVPSNASGCQNNYT